MVLSEEYSFLWDTQLGFDLGADPELVNQPSDHRLAKYFVGLGVGLKNGHQDTVEFSKGLFEEYDVIQLRAFDPGRLQAEIDCLCRELEIMLDAGESLFFSSSDQLAVPQKSRGSVMVVA